MITKKELENAARAMGLDGEWSDTFPNPPKGEPMFIPFGGRGDEAHNGYIERAALIHNGDKQKALAEAVVSVASQIWGSKQ